MRVPFATDRVYFGTNHRILRYHIMGPVVIYSSGIRVQLYKRLFQSYMFYRVVNRVVVIILIFNRFYYFKYAQDPGRANSAPRSHL